MAWLLEEPGLCDDSVGDFAHPEILELPNPCHQLSREGVDAVDVPLQPGIRGILIVLHYTLYPLLGQIVVPRLHRSMIGDHYLLITYHT